MGRGYALGDATVAKGHHMHSRLDTVTGELRDVRSTARYPRVDCTRYLDLSFGMLNSPVHRGRENGHRQSLDRKVVHIDATL
jgi:hypothetical protein